MELLPQFKTNIFIIILLYLCYNICIMNNIGIIAEFNPFTKGHEYFIKTLRKQGAKNIIAIMSGSFTQRGEPAFANKFSRAKTAIQGGVDLIFELPTSWILGSAERFAKGGIELLKATGLIDTVACGTENPNFNFANCIKEIKNSQEKIKNSISKGCSYAQALSENITNLPKEPNDILALEYTKFADNFAMHYVKRYGDYHSENLTDFASASAIRKNWQKAKNYVPFYTWETLQNQSEYDKNLFWQLIKYRLLTLSTKEIYEQTTTNEGLENLLKKAQNSLTYDDALKICSTKRYPSSRIRRHFAQILLCQKREVWQENVPKYLRILAFNDKGKSLLKKMKVTATLPIITKAHDLYPADIMATDMLAILQNKFLGSDFTTTPIYIK